LIIFGYSGTVMPLAVFAVGTPLASQPRLSFEKKNYVALFSK
jgi:hypothetical protein